MLEDHVGPPATSICLFNEFFRQCGSHLGSIFSALYNPLFLSLSHSDETDTPTVLIWQVN